MKANPRIGLAAMLAALIGWTPGGGWAEPALRAQGPWLVDAQGGVVTLRGLNIGIDGKVPPFQPFDDFSALSLLPGWGVNAVRLPFNWEALEPEPGQYDLGYLDYYERVIDACAEHGLWVIVDVHQDAFSRFSNQGCGEGFPAWAVPPDVPRKQPDNGEACKLWGVQMIVDLDMHRSWAAFHANEHGVRDRYLAMLETLAARVGGHEGVLGFDLLNEPWGDEVTEISALYEDAARAIRGQLPAALLFVSPHALTSSGTDTQLPRPSFDNFAYAPHYYDGGVLLLNSWSGSDPDEVVERVQAVATRWNVPWVLAEMGSPAEAEGALDYLDALYAALDRRFAGGLQWGLAAQWSPAEKDGWNHEDLSVIDDAHQMRANYRVRPFAARIAGEPESFEVTYRDRHQVAEVRLRWSHQPERGVTRLFVAPEAFGGQVRWEDLSGAGSLACTLEPDGLHLACSAMGTGEKALRVLPCMASDGDCLMASATDSGEPDPPGAGDPGTGDSGAGNPSTRDAGAGDPSTRDAGAGDRSTRDAGTGEAGAVETDADSEVDTSSEGASPGCSAANTDAPGQLAAGGWWAGLLGLRMLRRRK